MSGSRTYSMQVARSTPFDNSTNGFSSVETQSAIEEAKSDAISTAGFAAVAGAIPTMRVGQYLDFFSGLDSNGSPFPIPHPAIVTEISIRTPLPETVSMGIYKRVTGVEVLIYTISLSNSSSNNYDNLSIPLVIGNDLSVKVLTGSANKPLVAIFLRKEEI